MAAPLSPFPALHCPSRLHKKGHFHRDRAAVLGDAWTTAVWALSELLSSLCAFLTPAQEEFVEV